MFCIFCNADTSSSKSVEHIIPESLGNSTVVLRRGIVCDKCNNYFARKVEGPFLNSEAIRMLRQELEIKTKKGKLITSFDYPRIEKEKVKQITSDRYLIYTKEDKTKSNLDDIVREYQKYCEKTDQALMKQDECASRLLAKIAIEFFVYKCECTNDVCEYVRTDLVIKLLREYARYGNRAIWPYNVRRIYSRNEAYNGNPFESISWEADFLFLKNGDIYFVVAIHGVEYVINVVRSSIDGYRKWLDDNCNKSPLYISEEERARNFGDYAETMFNEAEKESLKTYQRKSRN